MTDAREVQIRTGQAINLAFQYEALQGHSSLNDILAAVTADVPVIVAAVNTIQMATAFSALPEPAPQGSAPMPASAVPPPPPVSGPGPLLAGPGPVTPAPIPGAPSDSESLWRELFNDFGNWFDNRGDKRSERSPDFRRKGKGDQPALWLSSRDTPQWVKDRLGV